MTTTGRELTGTKALVGRKVQSKFYCDPELLASATAILEEQGLGLTDGIPRLLALLTEIPKSLRPVLLKQAPGDAAVALIAHTLKRSPLSAQDAEDIRVIVAQHKTRDGEKKSKAAS